MSTDQLSSRRVPKPRGDTKLIQYDEYIDRQVESTRRVVKFVDLATSLVVLLAGVLAYLLVVAVVEHWLVPGGFSIAMRTALCALLAGGVGYFSIRRLWPLASRKINPIYAAQAIEVAAATGPSLKNSLINLLLFREKRSEISDAVYQTLEEQAAQRLSRVPVDSAVDRSLLIRLGYVLVAIVAIAALYKVLSPKDPLVTARRVLMPWANIVPASRVNIADITPGSVTVARGEVIEVSAAVGGISDDDAVLLRYSTDDGQAVDKSLPMKPSHDGLKFEVRLPEEHASTGEVGVAQNLRYRIEAGDARTLDYSVTVIPAPTILVERIEYDYPEYTGFVDGHVNELGDIRAIEGTRVTIRARANSPVDEAHVDFDADGRRELRMSANESTAHASFVLALREDGQTPEHASYVLRFTNSDGRPNRNPVKHSIDVQPDFSPEVAILQPQPKVLDVRLDETIAIEVEARDPDFALSDVRLRGEVAGRGVMDVPLLSRSQTGRFTARYQFSPSAHELRGGELVEYWVAANDNRTPTPNTTASEKKTFRIISPDPAQQPPPNRLAQRDSPQRDRPGEQQPQDGEQQPQDGAGARDENSGKQQPGQAGGQENQPGENQQTQNGQEGQQNSEQGDGEAQRSAEPGQGDTETGNQGESEASGENNRDQTGGESRGEGQPGQRDGQSNQPTQGEQQSSDKQTGARGPGGEPSKGAQPGRRPDSNNGASSAKGPRQDGDQQPANAEPSPVSSDGDNDAEAFERIHRHLDRNGELKHDETTTSGDEVSRDAQPSADEKGQGGKDTGKQGATESDNAPARDEDGQQGNSRDERGKGKDAETPGDDQKSPNEQPGDANERSDSPNGQETSTKDSSGAGDEQQSKGAPNSQPEMKPAEQREQPPSQGEQSDKTEPPAGASGKRESDAKGEQGGDRSGGGEEGDGQKAPREGTGSAGQNQPADEGAGESSEQGTGNDSADAGQDSVADSQTGQPSGETPGRGSSNREGVSDKQGGTAGVEDDPARDSQNDDSGHDDDQRASRDQTAERSAESDSARPSGNERANQQGSPTGGGGEQGTTAGPPPRTEGTVPAGDEANLEYARKQTDLVLERLADQLNDKKVDDELLKQLDWSEDDMRKFVERWQQRKQAAKRNDESGDAARRELDEALRSLGLHRGPMKQGPVRDDKLRDLREGYRGPVPLEYQERLRAYNQGVSRARQDDE